MINKSIFLFLILFSLEAVAADKDYIVIVNKANKASEIKKSTLKRVFLGKMKKWEGKKVIPINLPESEPVAQKFIKDVTKKEYTAYKKYWVAQQIKGAGSAPLEQKTATAVKLIVSEIPGAIGYIPKKELDDSVKEIKIK